MVRFTDESAGKCVLVLFQIGLWPELWAELGVYEPSYRCISYIVYVIL